MIGNLSISSRQKGVHSGMELFEQGLLRITDGKQSKDLMKQDQEPGLKYTADLGMGMLNALNPDVETSSMVTRLFAHSAPDDTPSPLQMVQEVPLFLRSIAGLLGVV